MAVPQQAGLTQSWDGGETGHRVGRKQVLSLLGASQGHNSRRPASAMGKLPHKAHCCHCHQNSLAGRLPPWDRQGTWGETAVWGSPRDGQAASLGWTSHPKQQGLAVKAPRASPSLNLVQCQRGPHSGDNTWAVARLVSSGKLLSGSSSWHSHVHRAATAARGNGSASQGSENPS